jgi:hypothetical protein
MVVKLHRLAAVLLAMAALSCAGANIEGEGAGSGAGGGGPAGEGGSGGKSGPAIDLDAAPPPPDLRKADMPAVDAKPYRCDDAGNCNICLAILSLGVTGKFGAGSGSQDNTSAFQEFMNTNTSGTAHMDMLTTFTSLTDDLLNRYDVVILQFMGQDVYTDYGIWKFQQSDADALYKWVNEREGAVIAMSGYSGLTAEVGPLNQLMAPFGISYNTDDIFAQCPDNYCYCSYSSIPFNSWIGSPECSSITTNSDGSPLGKVGIFHGRSINCPGADCNVFAKDPTSGVTVGVGKLVGKGRVFAFADEWVTYTSQWGLAPDTSQTGFDDFSKNPDCRDHTPNSSYAVPQFWYNVFKWTVPSAACFIIDQPEDPGQGIIY